MPPLRLSAAVLALALLAPGAAAEEVRINVSLSERTLELWQGDAVVKSYEVAIGKPEHPTPQGEFLIRKVIWNPGWVPPDSKWARGKTAKKPGDPDNPIKAVKIFFRQPDYYIHGTDEIDSIGRAASHGCIRMTPEDATELGKVLMEHGGKPLPDPWYRRIFRSRKSQAVRLSQPIAIVVRK